MSSITTISDIQPQSPELETPDNALAACTIPEPEPDGSPENSNLSSRLISDDGEAEEELRMMTEERDKKQLAASLRANV